MLAVALVVGIWWWAGAKHRYHGPVRTIDEAVFEPMPEPPASSAAIAGGSE